MTPLQKGYATLESGTFLANTHFFVWRIKAKELFLTAKWDASVIDFAKMTFLQESQA
jgi:hypothetical protein